MICPSCKSGVRVPNYGVWRCPHCGYVLVGRTGSADNRRRPVRPEARGPIGPGRRVAGHRGGAGGPDAGDRDPERAGVRPTRRAISRRESPSPRRAAIWRSRSRVLARSRERAQGDPAGTGQTGEQERHVASASPTCCAISERSIPASYRTATRSMRA